MQQQKREEAKPTYPYTTSIVSNGRRKFHTTHEDGLELVEEYDLRSNELVVRKTRRPTALGGEGQWQFEVGGDFQPFHPMRDLFAPSSKNPIFSRKDSEHAFQWRVRNCPWPKDNYSVSIDSENQQIVIQTKNKKYYKKFEVEDLKRIGLKLKESDLQWTHANNTLVISYSKPYEIKKLETSRTQEIKQMSKSKEPRDGDVQCPQQ